MDVALQIETECYGDLSLQTNDCNDGGRHGSEIHTPLISLE
jgi:hypothetical protein